jgi:preprotein translocase subunit SecG
VFFVSPWYIAASVLLLLVSAGVIVMIMMQNKRTSGLSGSLSGMGASNQTYWDRNKGRSIEGTLERYTKIGGALLMLLCLALNVIQ